MRKVDFHRLCETAERLADVEVGRDPAYTDRYNVVLTGKWRFGQDCRFKRTVIMPRGGRFDRCCEAANKYRGWLEEWKQKSC